MVQINFAQKSVTVKIVYYGPGMSGKTTNLEVVHQRAPENSRGDLTSISTDGDRTLFFDFMPLDLGTVAGMRTQFQIYTVPGQVYYNSTRKLVLQGVDGVIFIADSSASMMEENLESLKNLEENLAEYGKNIETMPMVLQYNKRDLPDALPVEDLERALNTRGVPSFEGVANTGQGVFPTLKALAALVLDSIHEQTGTSPGGGASAARVSAPPAPASAPVAPPAPIAPAVPAPVAQTPQAPAVPAGAPGTQEATGFYPAPAAQMPPQSPAPAPPAAPVGQGVAPLPEAPPQAPPQVPAAQPPVADGGVPSFPQPATPPQYAPQQLPGQAAGPQQTPDGQPLRLAAQSQYAPGPVQPIAQQPVPVQPVATQAMMHPAGPGPASGPHAPMGHAVPTPKSSTRIRPRNTALPTPTSSSGSKSALVTAIFMLVALGAGVAIGGFAFGLF